MSSYYSTLTTAQTICVAQAAAAFANQHRVLIKSFDTAAFNPHSSSQNYFQNHETYCSLSDYLSQNYRLNSTNLNHLISQIEYDSSFNSKLFENPAAYQGTLFMIKNNHLPCINLYRIFKAPVTANSEISKVSQINRST